MMQPEQHFELCDILGFSLFLASPVLVISFISQLLFIKKYTGFSLERVTFSLTTQLMAFVISNLIWLYWPFSFDIVQGFIFLPLLFIELPIIFVTYFYFKKQ